MAGGGVWGGGGGGVECVETCCYVVCLENNIDRPKFVFDRLKSNSAGHSDRRLFYLIISPGFTDSHN